MAKVLLRGFGTIPLEDFFNEARQEWSYATKNISELAAWLRWRGDNASTREMWEAFPERFPEPRPMLRPDKKDGWWPF